MTKADVLYNRDTIFSIAIHDHAGFDVHGKDVVCAGISTVAVGALNAIDQLCPHQAELEMSPGYILIRANHPDSRLQLCMEFLLCQLETIQAAYPGYIRIKRKEV